MSTRYQRFFQQYLIILLFFGWSLNIHAQLHYEINSSNAVSVVQEIVNDLGGISQATTTDIHHFLIPFFSSPSNPNISGPDARLFNYDADHITFRWLPFLNSDYQLGYLNLRTGDSDVNVTNQPNYTFNVLDDLYLFAFKASGPSSGGSDDSSITIIIFDKVIAIEADTSLACDCYYKTSQLLDNEEEEFPGEAEFELFIANEGFINIPVYKIYFERSPESESTYLYNPECVVPGILNQGNQPPFLVTVGGFSVAAISIGSELNAIYFDVQQGYELRLGVCERKKASKSNSVASLNAKSGFHLSLQNNMLNIQGETIPDQNYRILLYNLTGQLLDNISSRGIEQMHEQLDISNYPTGLYIIRIESESTNWVKTFIK